MLQRLEALSGVGAKSIFSSRISGIVVQTRGKKSMPQAYLMRGGNREGLHVPRSQMRDWLGPKAVNGDYSTNVFCYAPKNHIPTYIPFIPSKGGRLRALSGGNRNIDSGDRSTAIDEGLDNPAPASRRQNRDKMEDESTYRPFPLNKYAKTSFLLSEELKKAIITESKTRTSHRELSSMFGVKRERVEAVLKLADIEAKWESEKKLLPELEQFASRMYSMLPITNARLKATKYGGYRRINSIDQLGIEATDEVVIPQQAGQSNFNLVEESVQFGSKDAADFFGVPEAKDLLEVEQKKYEERLAMAKSDTPGAKIYETSRFIWKALPAKSGKVGYQYGAPRDDRRAYRKKVIENGVLKYV
ncbi:eukaryotic mitochondrial regulator protein-domain-containing protein [Dipodascopsis uninucleata]